MSDFGKAVNDYKNKAVKKTKELSDINKLNNGIANEEKKINDYYLQLGKRYYFANRNNNNSEYFGLIKNINNSYSIIKSIHMVMQDIKGMNICPLCKKPNDKTNLFCIYCGNKIK